MIRRICIGIVLLCSCLSAGAGILDSFVIEHPFLDENVLVHNFLEHHQMLESDGKAPEIMMRHRPVRNHTGKFFLTLSLLFAFAGFRRVYGSGLEVFIQNFSVPNTSNSGNIRKGISQIPYRLHVLFLLVYLLGVGYILYLASANFLTGPNRLSVSFFLIALLGAIGLFLFRRFSETMVVWIWNLNDLHEQTRMVQRRNLERVTMVLFPCCIVMMLCNGMALKMLLLLMAILFIGASVIRYLHIMNGLKKAHVYHFLLFFTYICAFEILPLLAFARFMAEC